MRDWEERCSSLLCELEPSRSYLAAFAAGRSGTADDRVLDDPALLLTFCRQQEILRNVEPAEALRSSSRAFLLIRQRIASGADPADLGYFAADLATSASTGATHLKYREAAVAWSQAAEFSFQTTPGCEWLSAIAASQRIMVLFSLNELFQVVRETPSVIHDLRVLGADRMLMSVRIAEAQALKALGRHPESIRVLESLVEEFADGEAHRLGIGYLHLADARLETGDVSGAIRACQQSYSLLQNCDSVLARPALQTVVGQLLRVLGRPAEAVGALREAAENYRDNKLPSWAAYARILSAETLLLAERPREALEELLPALAFLEGSEAEQEVWGAVKLLREALRAANPLSSELESCRETLEQIRKGHL
jgi:tetratricopeptide (TPR) repeat protein